MYLETVVTLWPWLVATSNCSPCPGWAGAELGRGTHTLFSVMKQSNGYFIHTVTVHSILEKITCFPSNFSTKYYVWYAGNLHKCHKCVSLSLPASALQRLQVVALVMEIEHRWPLPGVQNTLIPELHWIDALLKCYFWNKTQNRVMVKISNIFTL